MFVKDGYYPELVKVQKKSRLVQYILGNLMTCTVGYIIDANKIYGYKQTSFNADLAEVKQTKPGLFTYRCDGKLIDTDIAQNRANDEMRSKLMYDISKGSAEITQLQIAEANRKVEEKRQKEIESQKAMSELSRKMREDDERQKLKRRATAISEATTKTARAEAYAQGAGHGTPSTNITVKAVTSDPYKNIQIAQSTQQDRRSKNTNNFGVETFPSNGGMTVNGQTEDGNPITLLVSNVNGTPTVEAYRGATVGPNGVYGGRDNDWQTNFQKGASQATSSQYDGELANNFGYKYNINGQTVYFGSPTQSPQANNGTVITGRTEKGASITLLIEYVSGIPYVKAYRGATVGPNGVYGGRSNDWQYNFQSGPAQSVSSQFDGVDIANNFSWKFVLNGAVVYF